MASAMFSHRAPRNTKPCSMLCKLPEIKGGCDPPERSLQPTGFGKFRQESPERPVNLTLTCDGDRFFQQQRMYNNYSLAYMAYNHFFTFDVFSDSSISASIISIKYADAKPIRSNCGPTPAEALAVRFE